MLSLLIISSMVTQVAVSAFEVHIDTPTSHENHAHHANNHAHNDIRHIDMLKHNGTIVSHTHDDQYFDGVDGVDGVFGEADLAEHCCYTVTTSSVAMTIDTSSLFTLKLSINNSLHISNLYKNPVFESLIRPPIA